MSDSAAAVRLDDVAVAQHVGVRAPEFDRRLDATVDVLGTPLPRQRWVVIARVGAHQPGSAHCAVQLHRDLRRQYGAVQLHKRRHLHVAGLVALVPVPHRQQAIARHHHLRELAVDAERQHGASAPLPGPDSRQRALHQIGVGLARPKRRRDVSGSWDRDGLAAHHPALKVLKILNHGNFLPIGTSVSSFPTHQRRHTSADRVLSYNK